MCIIPIWKSFGRGWCLINCADFFKKEIFELQDSDGSFSGNLVNDDKELGAKSVWRSEAGDTQGYVNLGGGEKLKNDTTDY